MYYEQGLKQSDREDTEPQTVLHMYRGVTERRHRRSVGNCIFSPGLGTQDKNHQSHHVFFKHIQLTSKSIENVSWASKTAQQVKVLAATKHDGLSCSLHPHFWKCPLLTFITLCCVYKCTHMWGSFPSFYHVGFRDRTQVMGLGQTSYPLPHLSRQYF